MKSLAAALLLATPILANAYTIAPDVIDFNPNPLVTTGHSFSYSHNLTDNAGYNPLDNITNFQLTLKFADASSDWFDLALIDIDYAPTNVAGSDAFTGFFNWSYASLTTDATANGLLQIKDGVLDVTVSSLLGNFYLDKSTLVATAKTTVPEPSSVALLAAGLLGIAVMRRKSKA